MKTIFKATALGLAATMLSVTFAAAATRAEKAKAELAKYEKTGNVESCLQTYRIRNSNVIDDQHIIFETSGGKYYLNTLPYKCSQLGFEQRFGYTLSGPAQLCNVDFITVLTTTGPGASCGLGKFEEVLKKKPTK